MVCETESIPAFVENICEFIKTTKKKTQMDNYICVLVYCCDFAFTTVLEQVDQEQKRGMKGEEFFLFSFFFLFFILFFLSLSPSFAQNLDRKLLLRRLSRNGIKIYLR